MSTSVRARRDERGFSFVELLVTIVLAGIIFAAMVPVFVSAQKASSGDRARNIASNVAQDRIEKIRLLGFDQIVADENNPTTVPNLYNGAAAFAGGQFGGTYAPPGSTKPYQIDYTVENVPSTGAVNYKRVSVTVTWTAPPSPVAPVTMQTIVMNPAATSNSSSPSPSPSPSSTPTPTPTPTPGSFKLTVMVNADTVTTDGVTVVRTDVTPNTAMPPASQIPTTTVPVYWTGLPAGKYLVTCNYHKGRDKQRQETVTLGPDYSLTFDIN